MSASRPSTYADQAADSLQDAVEPALSGISAAVRQAIAAQGSMRDALDVVAAMQAAVAVILACEAMHQAAKSAEATARAALAHAMQSTGATTIETAGHAVSLRDAPQLAVVTNPLALPPEFMRARLPEVDRPALRQALVEGRTVPGAELGNGGASTVSIRSISL